MNPQPETCLACYAETEFCVCPDYGYQMVCFVSKSNGKGRSPRRHWREVELIRDTTFRRTWAASTFPWDTAAQEAMPNVDGLDQVERLKSELRKYAR